MSTTDLKVKGNISLKSIVANVKNETEDYSPQGYNRLLQLAIRGIKFLNLHAGLSYESVWLELSDIKTVSFPSDFVKFLAIGIPYNGRLWTYTKESDLINPLSEAEGVQAIDSSIGEDNTIGDGGYVGGYGTSGGRNQAYYKVDINNEQILLNGFTGTKVLLYYRSTGISLSGETRIPGAAEEAVIAFVHWKRLAYTKANQYDKSEAKKEFDRQYEVFMSTKMPTPSEWYDSIFAAWHQSPKR